MSTAAINILIYLGLSIAALCVGAGLFVITEAISLRREAKRDRDKFRRRFATGCRPFMMVLLFAIGCSVARGQEPPKSICGTNIVGPNILSRHTELIQVSCIDWAALAKIGALPVPANAAPQTQILIHARTGETFLATVDGIKLAGVLYDRPDGLKGGMVVIDGVTYKELKISVQGDLP